MGRSEDGLFWERFTQAYPVKAIAIVLVLALVYTGCGGKELVTSSKLGELDYDSLPAKAPRPTKPAEKLHAAVSDLERLLAIQRTRDLTGSQADRARAARGRITGEVLALRRQFAADRTKLQSLGAEAALTRLKTIEARTGRLGADLDRALAAVPSDGSRAAGPAARAARLLVALSPAKPEQPLSSNLGFGLGNARPQPATLSAGLTPAYLSPTELETPSDLPRAPDAEDLAATPETRVSPAIHGLATSLGGDPVKIYEYVRNSIRYEPYYGIRKGADQTLAERSGSDADQAALLVALLRDSGIHSRFVQGVSQLPAAAAANWVGVDLQGGERVDAAADILASSGVPTTQVRANGQLTKIRFAHVWAEAYVPADAYRGAEEQLGGKTWLALDPSIKQNELTRPVAGLRASLKADAGDLAQDFADATSTADGDAILAPGTDALSALSDDAAGRIRELMSGDLNVADVLGSTTVRPVDAPYLPSSLPAQTVSVSGEDRAVPSSLQARVSFSVSGSDPLSIPDYDEEGGSGGLSYTAPTTDLANKRITLAYVPATPDDAEIIDAYHGLLNAPSYAASLIPVLRVDGKVVARGHTAVSTGYTQTFDITYRSPGYAADKVTNPVFVGSLSAVGLDVGTVAGSQVKAHAAALAEKASSITPENVLTDANGGEMLAQLASLYFLRNDAFNSMLGRAAGVHQARDLSGAITATSITPSYIGSFPVSTRFDGLTIDVDQDSQVVVDKSTGDESTIDSYMRLSGMNASASEAAIFEYALGWSAVSTTRILHVAAEQGIPLHQVTAENVDAELQRLQLDSSVESRIAAAVAKSGVVVVTPEREVTFGGWSGVGYVISDGTSTDYRISGGISGGTAPSPRPGSTTAELSAAAPRLSERAEEAGDCNELGIVLMALMLVLLILMIFALGYLLAAAEVPFVMVHVISIGVVVDSPWIWALATPVLAAVFLGMALWNEAEEC